MEFGSQSSAIQGVTPCPKKDQVAASESSESSESFDVQKTSSQAIPFRAWLLEMVLLNLVFVMWNTDNWALPAVYTSIGKHFGASPGSLAPLGLVKGVFESVFALPAGFLADRLPRPLLVFVGCSIWSAGLVGCAIAPSLSWMIVFRAVNGVGLGIVQPLLYSLVADKSAAHGRGKAFGALEFTGKLGQTALTAMATAMSAHQIASIGGWQFALLLIAGLSALVGALCFLLVKDEAGRKDTRSMAAIIWEETPRLRKIVCLPTFLVIIGQGIFGTAPWFAFSYLTMWLELNCYSHGQAAVIIAFWNIGGAVSALVGGVVVDLVARRLPDHGPPLISQVAVLLSIPMFALILFGLGGMGPPEGLGSSVLMALIFFLTGTMISWCTVMNNKMFADIVPREAFSYVFSLDCFLEGALGASGQPMVGWLTDSVFQFNAAKANASDCSPDNAMKLGKGIFTVAAVGFTLCFMFYSMAHYTYPKDRRAMAARVASGDKEKQREGGSF